MTNAIAFRWLAAVVIVLCLQVSSLCAGPPGACATDLAAMTQEHQRLAHGLEQWGRQQPGSLSESGAEAGKRRLVLWHPGTELVIPLPYALGATGSGHHSLPPADLSERLARDFPQLREGWVYALADAEGVATCLLGVFPRGPEPDRDWQRVGAAALLTEGRPETGQEFPVLLDISQPPDQPLRALGGHAALAGMIRLDAALVQRLQELSLPRRGQLVLAMAVRLDGRLRLSRVLLPVASLAVDPALLSGDGVLVVNSQWPAHQPGVLDADNLVASRDGQAGVRLPRPEYAFSGVDMALSVRTPEGDWYDYRVTSLPDPGTAQDAELILPLRYLLMLAAAPAFFDGALSFVRRGTPGREPQVLFRLPLRGAVLDILGENPVHLARLLSNPAALSRQSLRPLQEGCPGKGQVPSGRELALKIRGKGRAETSGPAEESPSSPLAEEMRAWLEKDSRFVLPEAQDPGIRLSLVHLPTKDVVPLSLSTVQTVGAGSAAEIFRALLPFSGKGLDALAAELPVIKSSWLYSLTDARGRLLQLLPAASLPLAQHRGCTSLPIEGDALDLHRFTPRKGVEFPCIADITRRDPWVTALNTGSQGPERLTHLPVSVLRQMEQLPEEELSRLALVTAVDGPEGPRMMRLLFPIGVLADAEVLDAVEDAGKSTLSVSLAWPLCGVVPATMADKSRSEKESGPRLPDPEVFMARPDGTSQYDLVLSIEDTDGTPLYQRLAMLPRPVDWYNPKGNKLLPSGQLVLPLSYLLSLAHSPRLRHGRLFVVARASRTGPDRVYPLYPQHSVLELIRQAFGHDESVVDYWLSHPGAAATARALNDRRVSCRLPVVDGHGRLIGGDPLHDLRPTAVAAAQRAQEPTALPPAGYAQPVPLPAPPVHENAASLKGEANLPASAESTDAASSPTPGAVGAGAAKPERDIPADSRAQLSLPQIMAEARRAHQGRQERAGDRATDEPAPDTASAGSASSPTRPLTASERVALMRYVDRQPIEQLGSWLWQGLVRHPLHVLAAGTLLYAGWRHYTSGRALAEAPQDALIRKALAVMGADASPFASNALEQLVWGTPEEVLPLWTPDNLAWWTLFACQRWCAEHDCHDDVVAEAFLHYVLAPVTAAEEPFRRELALRFNKAFGEQDDPPEQGSSPWERVVERRCQGLPAALDYDPVTQHWWLAELDAQGLLLQAYDLGGQQHIPVKVLRRSFLETELTGPLHTRFENVCGQGRLTDATNQYRPVVPWPLAQEHRAPYTCASLDGTHWRALDRAEAEPGLYGVPALLGHARAVDQDGFCVAETLEPELTVLYGDGSSASLVPQWPHRIPVSLPWQSVFPSATQMPDDVLPQVQVWQDRSWTEVPVEDGGAGLVHLLVPPGALCRARYKEETMLFTLDRLLSRLELWSWPAQPLLPGV